VGESDLGSEEEVTSKTSETLPGRSTMRPAPVLTCSSSPPTASCQGQKTAASQDQARKASTDDGRRHRRGGEYRDEASKAMESHVTSNRNAVMGNPPHRPLCFVSKFWAVENVVTRGRTASGHVNGADDLVCSSLDRHKGYYQAR
jgi:hypothetical protein